MLLWPITNQHKIERFSSPQDMGVLPAVSDGEDSLKNWPENAILDNDEEINK